MYLNQRQRHSMEELFIGGVYRMLTIIKGILTRISYHIRNHTLIYVTLIRQLISG